MVAKGMLLLRSYEIFNFIHLVLFYSRTQLMLVSFMQYILLFLNANFDFACVWAEFSLVCIAYNQTTLYDPFHLVHSSILSFSVFNSPSFNGSLTFSHIKILLSFNAHTCTQSNLISYKKKIIHTRSTIFIISIDCWLRLLRSPFVIQIE